MATINEIKDEIYELFQRCVLIEDFGTVSKDVISVKIETSTFYFDKEKVEIFKEPISNVLIKLKKFDCNFFSKEFRSTEVIRRMDEIYSVPAGKVESFVYQFISLGLATGNIILYFDTNKSLFNFINIKKSLWFYFLSDEIREIIQKSNDLFEKCRIDRFTANEEKSLILSFKVGKQDFIISNERVVEFTEEISALLADIKALNVANFRYDFSIYILSEEISKRYHLNRDNSLELVSKLLALGLANDDLSESYLENPDFKKQVEKNSMFIYNK